MYNCVHHFDIIILLSWSLVNYSESFPPVDIYPKLVSWLGMPPDCMTGWVTIPLQILYYNLDRAF